MYAVEIVAYINHYVDNVEQVSIVSKSQDSYEDAIKKGHEEGFKKYGITSDDISKVRRI